MPPHRVTVDLELQCKGLFQETFCEYGCCGMSVQQRPHNTKLTYLTIYFIHLLVFFHTCCPTSLSASPLPYGTKVVYYHSDIIHCLFSIY